MIFASQYQENDLDGRLLLIHPNRKFGLDVSKIVPNLRLLLERWSEYSPRLKEQDKILRQGSSQQELLDLSSISLMACLPRTWLFVDGSAFIHHIRLVRKARQAEPPSTLLTVPLVYQAESGSFLAPQEVIPQVDFSHGTDFEAEVGVLTERVEIGTSPEEALKKIRLITLINDVSLRGLIPQELAQGFGFFVSKPQKALSPFAVTPDELGEYWQEGRVHLPLNVNLNGESFGRANAGEMHFHFGQLISHIAQTRPLVAGSLVGSGTVSNEDPSVGCSCLVEKRTLEIIANGEAKTSYLKDGDQVKIWMEFPQDKLSIFGEINQKVKSLTS